jgi:hypothetical protein
VLIKRAIIAVTALALMVAMAIPAFGQDDVNTATNTQTGQSGSIAQTALQCVEADEGNLVECLIAAQNNGNGDDNGDQTTVDQANVGNEQNAAAFGGEGGDNNAIAVGVGDDLNVGDEGLPTIALLDPNDDEGDDNVAAFNQQQQCQPATASNQIENDAAVQNDTILSNNNAGDVENIGNVCQVGAAVAQQQNDDDN